MQTFLPYADFQHSAMTLDRMRLGKQRVEVVQILNALTGKSKGWTNHPATRMWRGYEPALALYGIVICDEWTQRGYRDTCRQKILDTVADCELHKKPVVMPDWLGDEVFHASHQSSLYRKNPSHYGIFGFCDDVADYVWPV